MNVRILGYYLIVVELIRVGLFVRSHGALDFIVLIDIIGEEIGIHAGLVAFWLSVLWFSGLAMLMVLGRRPLKTYIISVTVWLLTRAALPYAHDLILFVYGIGGGAENVPGSILSD
jgi:hypothetical protein